MLSRRVKVLRNEGQILQSILLQTPPGPAELAVKKLTKIWLWVMFSSNRKISGEIGGIFFMQSIVWKMMNNWVRKYGRWWANKPGNHFQTQKSETLTGSHQHGFTKGKWSDQPGDLWWQAGGLVEALYLKQGFWLSLPQHPHWPTDEVKD